VPSKTYTEYPRLLDVGSILIPVKSVLSPRIGVPPPESDVAEVAVAHGMRQEAESPRELR
jgi:hypothetical protein